MAEEPTRHRHHHYAHRSHAKHERKATETAGSDSSRTNSNTPQHGTATQNAPFVNEGVKTTGTYPKFVPPKAATTQMTDAQKKAFEKQMQARMKETQQGKNETAGEYAERMKLMKALQEQHAKDVGKNGADNGQGAAKPNDTQQ